MFKRKIYGDLLQCKKESQGKTALLVEGARRVGKSKVVENFAQNEYERSMTSMEKSSCYWWGI